MNALQTVNNETQKSTALIQQQPNWMDLAAAQILSLRGLCGPEVRQSRTPPSKFQSWKREMCLGD